MNQILTTSRLYLREFSKEDASSFYLLNKDPEVIKYTGDPPFSSVKEAELFIENYSAYKDIGYGRWAVCLLENDSFIGFCGLKFHPKENITEIGFRFFKEQWNNGFATESAAAVIDYGFKKIGLSEIYAHAQINNLSSQRVIEKCGLQFVKNITHDDMPAKLYCIKKNQQQ
ncbi:MAG: GNAT family N-acetyltransferase [Flavobacteriaceae bacterium]|nr:GNAT family N-acetyltransferase [Flavobacteriaceae bacterium]